MCELAIRLLTPSRLAKRCWSRGSSLSKAPWRRSHERSQRDFGVKEFGSVIPGHGGMLDRVDSLCYAAPIFFHYVRYFYIK